MQSVATHGALNGSDRMDIPVFSVVIAFEDFDTGKRANRAYDFLVANLSQEWRVTSQMWKFEVLGIPELRQMAAEDVASANIIIISSRGDRELPTDVKAWIELWLGYRGDPVALFALFDCAPEQTQHAKATQTYLKRVAKRGRMEFFVWPQIGPVIADREHVAEWDRQRIIAGAPLVSLGGAARFEADYSHSGSNR
jgi:hypothetical protein